MQAKDALFLALRKKTGFEVVSVGEPTPHQLRVLGRVLDDPAGLNMNNWKILMHRLYTAMTDRPWKVDISKSYFLYEATAKLVFAWRLIFQGQNIADHYNEMTELVLTAPASVRADVTEMVLSGASADRNSTHGGRRGAGLMGKVVVGPMAVAQKMRGG